MTRTRALVLGLVALAVLAHPWPAAAGDAPYRLWLPIAPAGAGVVAPLPTSTPLPSATPTPDPRADVVFVFVQGLRSSSDSNGFDDYKASLAARGYADSQFVDYSYIGTVGYQCADTFQPFSLSYGYLRGLLANIRAHKPTARIVVVGHSLGGLLALNTLADALPGVVGVETIDAPLQGAGGGKLALMDVYHCAGTERQAAYAYPIFDYLDALHNSAASYLALWQSVGRSASARGAMLATYGNTNDCLYYPTLCGALGIYSDDRTSQVVGEFGTWLAPPLLSSWIALVPATGLSASHGALLKAPNGFLPYLVGFADLAARAR